MRPQSLDGHMGREIEIDLCQPCQSVWFDARENLQLTPGATLTMFRIIGEHVSRPSLEDRDIAKCPRCHAQLRRTQDMQRSTRFEYFRCPNHHGRLTTFFDFLKEKDFIRPLTPQQIAELRKNVQIVNCSNCGAPIDLAKRSDCEHCGSPLSMLDLQQAEPADRAAARRRAHRQGRRSRVATGARTRPPRNRARLPRPAPRGLGPRDLLARPGRRRPDRAGAPAQESRSRRNW